MVGPHRTSGTPDDKEFCVFVIIDRFYHRDVVGTDQPAFVVEVFHDRVNLRKRQTFYRLHRPSVPVFLDSEYYVSSSPVVDIIGECGDCLQGGLRFPGFLEFYSCPFYDIPESSVCMLVGSAILAFSFLVCFLRGTMKV